MEMISSDIGFSYSIAPGFQSVLKIFPGKSWKRRSVKQQIMLEVRVTD
ncbi:MAG: hypothetical protein K9N34_09980 [Candidatus Marinimicrobia bacterium]|nr:hypothetical protein [Candidatus Neomarinimicrobiota bacterium]